MEHSLAHEDANSIRGIYNRDRYREESVRMHQWWSDCLDELRDKVANRHSSMSSLAEVLKQRPNREDELSPLDLKEMDLCS